MLALKNLGAFLRRNDPEGFRYYLTLDRLDKTRKLICISFIWDGTKACYRGVNIEDFESKKGEKVLYSRGTSSGGDFSPTSIIVMRKPEATLRRIWDRGWFQKYNGDNTLIIELRRAHAQNKEKILVDLCSKYDSLDKEDKRGCLLTIKIIEDSEERYIGDFTVFRETIKKNVLRSWIKKYGETSRGRSECSVCKVVKDVVGYGFPFPFRSFDKKGFAPNLRPELAWKQLPLCEDCAYSLLAAKSFLEKNAFQYKIDASTKYYIIPDFPLTNPDRDLMDRILLGRREGNQYFISAEEYYTEIIQSQENLIPMSLIFLFFTVNQSQQLIEKYVEDVPPSRIKALYEFMNDVEALPIFQEDQLKRVIGEKKEGNWKFGSLDRMLWKVLPQGLYNYRDLALEYTKKLLRNEPINRDLLFALFAQETKRRFIREMKDKQLKFYEKVLPYMLNSFIFLNFIIACEGGKYGERKLLTNINDTYEKFFQEYPEAFDSPEKKAVFLEGVLTRFLTNVQYAQRESTPFTAKLYGLRLDVNKIRDLLGEIEGKLEAYDIGYTSLKEAVSKQMLKAENNGWKIANNEITYFFTLGMNLQGLFK